MEVNAGGHPQEADEVLAMSLAAVWQWYAEAPRQIERGVIAGGAGR